MPLFKVDWSLATELAIYSGQYIIFADDSDHALERAEQAIGPEARAAKTTIEQVGEKVFETRRKEQLQGAVVNATAVSPSRDLFAFEVAARANIIASTEKVAMTRFADNIRAGQSDGKYCKLLRTAVLEKEAFHGMGRAERHELSKHFIRVQGGSVNPK